MSFSIKALVQRFNTTKVGGIGLGTAIASAATLLGQGLAKGAVASFIAPHLGGVAASFAGSAIDSAVAGASATLIPAIAAAYIGRPGGLPQ